MRCNILITLFLVFASIWDTGKWIESKKMPGKCDWTSPDKTDIKLSWFCHQFEVCRTLRAQA